MSHCIPCYLFIFLALAVSAVAETSVTKDKFGVTKSGESVDAYTLKSATVEARILTYGGIVQSLKVAGHDGKVDDVVLGYDSLAGYESKENPYFGALIGRYGNRIAGGKFSLDGRPYTVPANSDGNALHGGPVGFNQAVWNAKIVKNGVELSHVSPDGDQGFPGTLKTAVRYTLSGSTLQIEYEATSDKDTVVNLTNHSYFNLSGQGNGDVLKHSMQIFASRYTPVNSALIPTGELPPVAGTPFDFRTPHLIGERINADDPQLHLGSGYDHNWVLDHPAGKLDKTAEVFDSASGRVLEVFTTEPGVQFYSANHLDWIHGKAGKVYQSRYAFCLETEHFPDSPNHPAFPTTTLRAGQKYHTVTQYRFSAR